MEDISDLAMQAAAAAAGYLAAVGKQVADKVKDTAADRLFRAIEPRLRGTASGATALTNLETAPGNPDHQQMVAAVLQDIAAADPAFGQCLALMVQAAVAEARSGQGPSLTGTHIQVSGGSKVSKSILAGGDVDNSKHTVRFGTGGLVVAVVLAAVLLGGAGVVGYTISQDSPATTDSAAMPGSAAPTTSRAGGSHGGIPNYGGLPRLVGEAVRRVYQDIANGNAEFGCLRFDDRTAQKFASNLGFRDCATAVNSLHSKVTKVNGYAESIPSNAYYKQDWGQVFVVRSCNFEVKGGPALGDFTLTKVDPGTWLITDHSLGLATCPPAG